MIKDAPDQSGPASFLNNHLAILTHQRMEKNLKRESHRYFLRNVHIFYWKQLKLGKNGARNLGANFEHVIQGYKYTKERGWDNLCYPFIPPKDGPDPRGPEYVREGPLAEFFNNFTRRFADIVSLGAERIWVDQHNTYIGNRRKPDLVLLDNRLQTFADKWEHVRSICQVKYRDTPDLVEEAYEQLYDNALFIFTKQDNRLFFIGFTMCGANLRAYLIHRGGTLESTAMSLHTEPGTVAQVLVAVADAEFLDIGYDPTISTPRYSSTMEPMPNLPPQSERTVKIQVAATDGSQKLYPLTVDTCLFSSHSVQGRRTRVFACLHPEYYKWLNDRNEVWKENAKGKGKGNAKEQKCPERTHLIVKDCWVDHPGRSDFFIHDLLKVRNQEVNKKTKIEPDGVAVYLVGQVDEVTQHNDWCAHGVKDGKDTNSTYFQQIVLDHMKKNTIRMMFHKRFVFETCGVGLHWFATMKEFVGAVLGAVQGHQNAYELDVLHRDVSAPNVMIKVDRINEKYAVPDQRLPRNGFLADWGLAIDLRKSSSQFSESSLHCRTGTYPYLSTELMFSANGHSVRHRACDDLESFFWILWVMSVNYTGPFDSARDWGSVERLMVKLTAQHSATMDYSTELCKPLVTQPESPEPSQRNAMDGATIQSWITEDVPSTPMQPTPTLQPAHTSSSISALVPVNGGDIANDIVSDRLRQGMLAQKDFITEIWTTRLDEDKQTRSYRVTEFASLGVPAWAKPGGHELDHHQVAMEKATLSWEMMKALITPYFAVPPFLEGMEKLYSLFKGDITMEHGGIFWRPPQQPPTHEDVIKILKEMVEGLTEGIDPYPTANEIRVGRKRYEAFLASGRFPEFPPPLAPIKNKRSPKSTKQPDDSIPTTYSSKRTLDSLGQVQLGRSPKKSRIDS